MYNCSTAISYGSFVTEKATGLFVTAVRLSEQDAKVGLGGLTSGEENCPPLTVGSLRHVRVEAGGQNG